MSKLGEMKLWLLQARRAELPNDDNPWKPWYDKSFGHVVRAETEDEARCIAHDNAGDENRGEFMRKKPPILSTHGKTRSTALALN